MDLVASGVDQDVVRDDHRGQGVGPPAHSFPVPPLRAAREVQQADLTGQRHPHANRVIAAVQRLLPGLQKLALETRRRRILVGPQHDAVIATAPNSVDWQRVLIRGMRYSYRTLALRRIGGAHDRTGRSGSPVVISGQQR
jgi:hypothetical protein